MDATLSLDGWDIGRFDDVEWVPWGGGDQARAKILANGDGYLLAYVEAQPGYRGDPHEHEYTEFSVVIDGELRNQGRVMRTGDAYVAAAGSTHTDFETDHGATYISIFKI
jgi:quercetin dioxygenase-like cupin family protein